MKIRRYLKILMRDFFVPISNFTFERIKFSSKVERNFTAFTPKLKTTRPIMRFPSSIEFDWMENISAFHIFVKTVNEIPKIVKNKNAVKAIKK